jgi:hypothetical protein
MPGEAELSDELPVYVPAAFSYEAADGPTSEPDLRRAHALYYCNARSMGEISGSSCCVLRFAPGLGLAEDFSGP